MIPLQFALRRRTMMAGCGGGMPISDLPLGTLINVGMDGGKGTPNYEIADKNNLVPNGVVLVRKNAYSRSAAGGGPIDYPGSTLDNLISTTIYNQMPQKLRDKMMDVTFALYSFSLSASKNITRKMFAPTYTMMGFGNNQGVEEGVALQLYTSTYSRIKTFDHPNDYWRLSSRAGYDSDIGGDIWYTVTSDGTSGVVSGQSDYPCAVPAFAIPSKTLYDPTPNQDGSYNLFQNTSISDLPLGTLINIGTDGGEGAPYYEIADKDNLVSGGVVLVRKNIHSKSAFGSSITYPGGTLDNKMTSIYNSLPERLQSKIMDATFALEGSGSITRKVFALTYTMAGFGANNGTTEGKALQHYNSNANRIKKYSGSADYWWLSSRYGTYSSRYVDADGTIDDGYDDPSSSYGVVPAFVIPSTTPYDPIPNPDGYYNLFQNKNKNKNKTISKLPLGSLINVGTDGGEGAPYYEIADKNNLVPGGVVLVRKNIYSESPLGSSGGYNYIDSTLDNLIKTTIYNKMPQKIRDKMMDVTFRLLTVSGPGDITRKMFTPTYTMAGLGNNNGVAEGKALQLYTSDASRIKTFNGSAASWWLSSKSNAGNTNNWGIDNTGASDNDPSDPLGVVPAFAIPSTTPYYLIPNPDGYYNLFQNTSISDLPLGTLINIGMDGGSGTPNYEIADINNLVPGGVVLVRKNIYSNSKFGSNPKYPNSTLDNLIKTTIYNRMPQNLRDKMMDVTFNLYNSGEITRKMFALTYTMAVGNNVQEVAEGKALQLYTSDASRIKTFNGSAAPWLLSTYNSESVWGSTVVAIGVNGALGYAYVTNDIGVVPAFAIPGDTLSKLIPNTDGVYQLIL